MFVLSRSFSQTFIVGETFYASMASAAPMLPSTKENTNYARVCRLLVDVGSHVLRVTFDKIRPPGEIYTTVVLTEHLFGFTQLEKFTLF